MRLKVSKSRLSGRVIIPGSKSHTIRALAIASLAEGRSLIHRPLRCSDTLSAASCYRALGAKIDTSMDQYWAVQGCGGNISVPTETIDVGNSGTTLRIAAGSAALAPKGSSIEFTGDDQIKSRPVSELLNSLRDLGADYCSLNGRAPLSVKGTLTGGRTSIKCPTSQYLSSLLMCCPLAGGDSEIEVTMLNEPGYVRMTLDWLDAQQIRYENQDMKHFKIPGGQRYHCFEKSIAADFSSATFFLCGAVLTGRELVIEALDFADSQPDKAVVEYLRKMGAKISLSGNTVTVSKSSLKGTEIDMNHTPDALPAIAAVAAFSRGQTRLTNVAQARNKETDRIRCMAEELTKMGVKTEEMPDGLIIEGGSPVSSAELDGRSDHRIVMALSLAAMAVEGTSYIDTAEAVNVTFPEYITLMHSAGAEIEIIN